MLPHAEVDETRYETAFNTVYFVAIQQDIASPFNYSVNCM